MQEFNSISQNRKNIFFIVLRQQEGAKKMYPAKGPDFIGLLCCPKLCARAEKKTLSAVFTKASLKQLHGKCVMVFIAIGGMI